MGGQRGLHGVGAGCIDDGVARVVDNIDVVAGSAVHRVSTRAAIERVIAGATIHDVVSSTTAEVVSAGVAGDGVGQIVTGSGEGCRPGVGQVLHIGKWGDRQCCQCGLHCVEAFTCQLDDRIADTDNVSVVSGAARKDVDATAVTERVVICTSQQGVVADPSVEGIETCTASDRVITAGTQNRVVSGTAKQRVVHIAAGQNIVECTALDAFDADQGVSTVRSVGSRGRQVDGHTSAGTRI